jgi:hypothetical protein
MTLIVVPGFKMLGSLSKLHGGVLSHRDDFILTSTHEVPYLSECNAHIFPRNISRKLDCIFQYVTFRW